MHIEFINMKKTITTTLLYDKMKRMKLEFMFRLKKVEVYIFRLLKKLYLLEILGEEK
jgi:hypothetical protein